jgi:hypothetical protein
MAITSGTPVKSGYYWNAKRWTFTHVAKDGEALRGGSEDRWVRVPATLVLAAAPVLGGVFVLALPVFGAVAIGRALVRRVGGGVKESAADLAAHLAPGPVPGEAHLTGKPGEEHPAAPAKDPALEALEKDIEGKRSR